MQFTIAACVFVESIFNLWYYLAIIKYAFAHNSKIVVSDLSLLGKIITILIL